MSKTQETGHANNVAAFETLISFVQGYGAAYNPSKATLQLTNLRTQATAAKTALTNYNGLMPAYSNAVAARDAAFEPLSKLSTRIFNSLKATDVTKQIVNNAETNHRKLQGRRATAKITEEEKAALLAEGKEVNQISASQRSYDNILNNLDKQIQLLTSIPQYAPNETELQVATLQTLFADLQTKNTAVINSTAPLSNARITRNKHLYDEQTGLVNTALDVKNYVKSLYGVSSPNYKQISGLRFFKRVS